MFPIETSNTFAVSPLTEEPPTGEAGGKPLIGDTGDMAEAASESIMLSRKNGFEIK